MTHKSDASRTLMVEALARVEGEGAMTVRTRDGRVEHVELRIYEPPRFFEAFLRGRRHTEPPDITARICGICPVAYQMSACKAIEDACGVTVEGPLADLRRLIYCGEWLESHVLHIYLLHAPDFLGYPGAVEMAADHREAVQRGLAMKKAGNELIELIGGRPIHPINVRVGGFYSVPRKRDLRALAERLQRARDQARQTVRWVAGFDFPDFDGDYELVAVDGASAYPFIGERVTSSGGLDLDVHDLDTQIVEHHVEHSTALHARIGGLDRPYLCGPLARYGLHSDLLSPLAREAAAEAGLGPVCRNPFQSIVVRAVEVLYAFDEALRLIDAYEEPDAPFIEVPPRKGIGHGVSEAPRGMLYHRYELDDDGVITSARIVPPTSQNQAQIEDDLRRFVTPRLHLDTEELTRRCEQAIRNYDPCISCATHFLDLRVVQA